MQSDTVLSFGNNIWCRDHKKSSAGSFSNEAS